MAICTPIQETTLVAGSCKKRKKGLKYDKPKQENKKKLEIYLNKIEK